MSNVRIKVDPAETNGIKINTTATAMTINTLGPVADAPSGTKTITGNGTVDVSGKASAAVNVQPVAAYIFYDNSDAEVTELRQKVGSADFAGLKEAAEAGRPIVAFWSYASVFFPLEYSVGELEGETGDFDIFTGTSETFAISSTDYTVEVVIAKAADGTGDIIATSTLTEVTEGD